MAPDVIRSKLILFEEVLSDLKPHTRSSRDEQVDAHYEIERQVQLIADISVSIASRVLVIEGIAIPDGGRLIFEKLAEKKLLPRALAKSMGEAVGLRNLIVHEYGKIDYSRFFGGLPKGFRNFVKFGEWARKRTR